MMDAAILYELQLIIFYEQLIEYIVDIVFLFIQICVVLHCSVQQATAHTSRAIHLKNYNFV